MRSISITNKTYSTLKRLAENPVSGWNIKGLTGMYMIQISDVVAEKLIELGADLDSPESIEKVIEELIRNY